MLIVFLTTLSVVLLIAFVCQNFIIHHYIIKTRNQEIIISALKEYNNELQATVNVMKNESKYRRNNRREVRYNKEDDEDEPTYKKQMSM